MPHPPSYVCPRCRGRLDHDPEAYRCAPCAAIYPIVAGIPDFRVSPDPWIGLEDDRAKALRVEREAAELGFEDTVRAYWAMTPSTPAERAAVFIEHVLAAEERSREWLDTLDAGPADGWTLDVGCGTGDLLAALAERGTPAVGVDIALRWLVVARKRPGLKGPLVCACAEALPFPDGSFGRVMSLGTLEHCADARRAVGEAGRVLSHPGSLYLRTVNRFSLLPEPHVGVWGVGLLPRRLADPYVRWRSGQRYLHHRLLSKRELQANLGRVPFDRVEVAAARLLQTERRKLSPRARRLVPTYEWSRRTPIIRRIVSWVSPLLEAEAHKC